MEDQIKYGSQVIITKDDLREQEEIDLIKKEIKNIRANEVHTGYKNQDDKWWQDILLKYSDGRQIDPASLSHSKHPESFALQNVSLKSGNMLIYFLELIVRGAFGNIDRAKGIIKCGDAMLRFDLVGDLWSVTGFDENNEDTVCVILGDKIDRNGLREFLVYKNR